MDTPLEPIQERSSEDIPFSDPDLETEYQEFREDMIAHEEPTEYQTREYFEEIHTDYFVGL